jgi:hypothetical protein
VETRTGGHHPHAEIMHSVLDPAGIARFGDLCFALQPELFHFTAEICAPLFHDDF